MIEVKPKRIGVFTTILIRDGEPLFWQSHTVRLHRNANRLGLVCNLEWLQHQIQQELSTKDIKDLALRVTLNPDNELHFSYRQLPPRDILHAALVIQEDTSSLPGDIKHTDREHWRGQQELYDVDELLWVNKHNQALEFTNGNLFVLRDGKLLTPKENGGFLPGIMRSAVIAYACRDGIPVHIKPIEIEAKDELYFSSSLRGLIPVSTKNHKNMDGLRSLRDGLWMTLSNRAFQEAVHANFILQNLR